MTGVHGSCWLRDGAYKFLCGINLASIQKVDPTSSFSSNTGPDIMSMDVTWSKVLQAYLRYHLRGGVVTLLRGVGV